MNPGENFDTLEPHFLGDSLDIATLAHMSILDTDGGTDKYPHYRQILFAFPMAGRTIIANKRNWNCDRVIVREVVLPRDSDEGEEEQGEYDDDGEGERQDT